MISSKEMMIANFRTLQYSLFLIGQYMWYGSADLSAELFDHQ